MDVLFSKPGRARPVHQATGQREATGQWNPVELIALGEDSIHVVNGQVVMRLLGPRRIDTEVLAPVTSGPIILQSEGAEIFYREIQVRQIAAIPAEFAPK